MKTTLDIHDELLERAKRHAQSTGRPLRAVVEEGLHTVLQPRPPQRYTMPDCRVGEPGAEFLLDRYSWPELRDLIYGEAAPR